MEDVTESHPGETAGIVNPLGMGRFRSLYETHARGAVALALLLTRDRALAEDIAQEAFIRVARRFGDLRDPAAFPAYLRKAVVNLARSHARRVRLERERLELIVAGDRGGADPSGERGDLWQALSLLPFRQRTALVLRFGEDLPEREVAKILDTSEKAVRSLVGRGKEALRKELGGRGTWTL